MILAAAVAGFLAAAPFIVGVLSVIPFIHHPDGNVTVTTPPTPAAVTVNAPETCGTVTITGPDLPSTGTESEQEDVNLISAAENGYTTLTVDEGAVQCGTARAVVTNALQRAITIIEHRGRVGTDVPVPPTGTAYSSLTSAISANSAARTPLRRSSSARSPGRIDTRPPWE
ncbi:hypothetical protein [Tsukamurella soli]|uniref:hypothetical protein n=1 Tax=Tsukamurella soli TaxID=644556 RepID=UPI0031E4FFD4